MKSFNCDQVLPRTGLPVEGFNPASGFYEDATKNAQGHRVVVAGSLGTAVVRWTQMDGRPTEISLGVVVSTVGGGAHEAIRGMLGRATEQLGSQGYGVSPYNSTDDIPNEHGVWCDGNGVPTIGPRGVNGHTGGARMERLVGIEAGGTDAGPDSRMAALRAAIAVGRGVVGAAESDGHKHSVDPFKLSATYAEAWPFPVAA